jgi:hypothetical protein
LKLEEQLWLFLKNPKLNIDNNPAENAIRPIALRRKNWLFAGSEPGRQHLAVMQGMAATCKANNINFRTWVEDVLVRIAPLLLLKSTLCCRISGNRGKNSRRDFQDVTGWALTEKEIIVYPDFWHEILPGGSDRICKFMMEMLK